MGKLLSKFVRVSSGSQPGAPNNNCWSVASELAEYLHVSGCCALENQATPVLHKYETKLSQMSNELVRQTLEGDANANVDGAVAEICEAEGIGEADRDQLAAQLRSCLLQIHSVSGMLAEAKKLKTLRFDCEDSSHEESLLELWSLLQPDVPLSGRVSKQWGEIGFQGSDPATDFRGMGYLGLLNLIYLAKNKTPEAQRLLLHSQHPTIGYGFALAGINMTSLVLELFTTSHLQHYFYKEFVDQPVTLEDFQDVFCGVFEQFDKFWIAKDPETLMAFNAVREEYKKELQTSLKTSFSYQLQAAVFTAGKS